MYKGCNSKTLRVQTLKDVLLLFSDEVCVVECEEGRVMGRRVVGTGRLLYPGTPSRTPRRPPSLSANERSLPDTTSPDLPHPPDNSAHATLCHHHQSLASTPQTCCLCIIWTIPVVGHHSPRDAYTHIHTHTYMTLSWATDRHWHQDSVLQGRRCQERVLPLKTLFYMLSHSIQACMPFFQVAVVPFGQGAFPTISRPKS